MTATSAPARKVPGTAQSRYDEAQGCRTEPEREVQDADVAPTTEPRSCGVTPSIARATTEVSAGRRPLRTTAPIMRPVGALHAPATARPTADSAREPPRTPGTEHVGDARADAADHHDDAGDTSPPLKQHVFVEAGAHAFEIVRSLVG